MTLAEWIREQQRRHQELGLSPLVDDRRTLTLLATYLAAPERPLEGPRTDEGA